MPVNSFVYIWRDKKQKMFYVGSHFGTERDGYVCGSKRMLAAYRSRPDDFRRKIIFRAEVSNHLEIKSVEQKWLDLIKPHEYGARYYNFSSRAYGADPARAREWMLGNKNQVGRIVSAETRKKISDAQRGIPQPEWLKLKLGALRKGRRWFTNGETETLSHACPQGWVRGRSASVIAARVGIPHNYGAKISAGKLAAYAVRRQAFGYAHSPETKAKISATKRAGAR